MDDSLSVFNEQQLLSHKMKENLIDINHQAIEELFDQYSILDYTQDETLQSSISISISGSKDSPAVKEIGIQTEPCILLPMGDVDRRYEPVFTTDSNQSTKPVSTAKTCKKKTTKNWSSKYHWQILGNISSMTTCVIDKQYQFLSKFRFNNSLTNIVTKLLPSILLATMITFYLLTGSTIIDKNVNSTTLTDLIMVSTDVIFQSL
jgi:hypothetical protein